MDIKFFDKWWHSNPERFNCSDKAYKMAELAWQASSASLKQRLLERMPEKKTNSKSIRDTFHEGNICGFNKALDQILKIIEELT